MDSTKTVDIVNAQYQEIMTLRKQLAEAQATVANMKQELAAQKQSDYIQSWRDSPDRMGGAFSQDEIDNTNNWR